MSSRTDPIPLSPHLLHIVYSRSLFVGNTFIMHWRGGIIEFKSEAMVFKVDFELLIQGILFSAYSKVLKLNSPRLVFCVENTLISTVPTIYFMYYYFISQHYN